jgi:hypothetical protein
MKNFNDVIQQLIDTNEQLISGKIKLEVAKQIAINTQIIINAAKIYIDIGKINKSDIQFLKDKVCEKDFTSKINKSDILDPMNLKKQADQLD